MPPKKSARKSAPRRKQYRRKPRMYRNPNALGGPNTCKVIETIPTSVINLNTPYLWMKAGITGTRAPEIARQFGLYRIAKIIYTFRPIFDTYSSSLAGVGNSPNSLPTLYWKMNRYGDFPNAFNGNYMRALGAKPYRLDDKNVVISYKPNTLLVQQDTAGNTPASIKITPWLSTDDTPQDNNFTLSTATHYGHTLFVEGGGAGNAQGAVANLDIKVVYEFKNPRVVSGSSITLPEGTEVMKMLV